MPRVVKNLPPDRRGKYQRQPDPEHVKLLKLLKRRPGVWVEVKEFNSSGAAWKCAHSIREGKYVAFREEGVGKFDARQRANVVYARYIEKV